MGWLDDTALNFNDLKLVWIVIPLRNAADLFIYLFILHTKDCFHVENQL